MIKVVSLTEVFVFDMWFKLFVSDTWIEVFVSDIWIKVFVFDTWSKVFVCSVPLHVGLMVVEFKGHEVVGWMVFE
jgi:hypothetical protein